VQRYKCVTLKYQSIEDWTEGTDILRCNPDFHGQRRFDCVIIHDDAPKLSVARLYDIFRCRLPSGKTLDIALVRRFHCSKWKPRTVWSGCRVLDEESDTTLVQMDYLLRGVVVCPVSEREEEKSHYFIDSIDPDIFLRENSWMRFELSVTVIPTKCRLQIIYGCGFKLELSGWLRANHFKWIQHLPCFHRKLSRLVSTWIGLDSRSLRSFTPG